MQEVTTLRYPVYNLFYVILAILASVKDTALHILIFTLK